MALIDRLQLLLKSEWNARTARASGPEALRLVGDARSELARAIDEERRLRRSYQDALDEVERAEQTAMEAVRRNDDPGARRALLEKRRHELEAEHLQRQLHLQQHQLVQLQQAVDALQRRLNQRSEDASTAAESPPWARGATGAPPPGTPSARFERVGGGARQPATDPPYGHPRDRWTSGGGRPVAADGSLAADAFERFDQIERRIENTEARVEAETLLGADGRSGGAPAPRSTGDEDPLADPLEERFRRLEFDAWKREQDPDDTNRSREGGGEREP